MYCTECGARTPELAKFCAKCGSQTADLPVSPSNDQSDLRVNDIEQVSPSASCERTPAQLKMPTKRSARMTYWWLSIEIASSLILIASGLFWLARMIASGNPELDLHLTGSGGGVVVLFAMLFALSQSWKRLQVSEPDSEARFRIKHRRFNQIAGGFAFMCCVVAITVGAQLGNCDATISTFTSDIKQNQTNLKSIGDVRRSANGTIDGYIKMYKSIEPDVAHARATLVRLRAEIPRCGSFQTRTARFEFILDNLDRQMALLSREIEIAKSIDSSPANEQESEWQSQIVPLANQELSFQKQLQAIGQP
jgi:hypothetical protein